MENTNETMEVNVNQTQEVPVEIKKWNWGAFYFNMYWGIGNKVYLPLLVLVPFLGIVWIFVCGAKGNEWAWKTGEFKDVESFLKTQETWNRGGLWGFIISIIVLILSLVILWSFIATLSTMVDYYYNLY